MNPQPARTYPNAYPDARIDQVLDALRTTEPPTGLEQRIAARLAQAAEARTLSAAAPSAPSSYIAVILNAVKDPCSSLAPAKFYSAAALTVVIALTTLTIVHHRAPVDTSRPTYAQSRVPHLRHGIIDAKVGIAPSATPIPGFEGAGLQSRHTMPASNPVLAEEASSPLPPSAQDPDAIALAETLAPSRPAPPMPLTAQEKLIQAATRPGQPIQLAELDLARAPVLRAAAEARQTASIGRYVRSLLAPFAAADALQPTTFSQPQEAPTSAPAEPTSNPSN
jgi:hypothetical protein